MLNFKYVVIHYSKINEGIQNLISELDINREDFKTKEYEGYIFVDTDKLSVENQIYSSFKRLLESYGFEFYSDGEVIKGSVIRKKIGYFFNWSGQNVDPDEIMRKTKHAIELAKIELVQSEINRNNFEAALGFVKETKDVENISIFSGSMVCIKHQGEVKIIELSTEQKIFLKDNPQLRNNPAKFWEEYQKSLDKSNNNQIDHN